MNIKLKSKLIPSIVRELKFKALELKDGSFCEGDAFFSLAFKSDNELIKIAKLCGLNSND